MSSVLYEDSHILIIDKPEGIPSQPLKEEEKGTALDIARKHDPNAQLLHRLDTGTSGTLAFARTQDAFSFYRSIWTTPEVKKTYRAIVEPSSRDLLASLPLEIRHPIIRLKKTSKRVEVYDASKTFQERQMKGEPLEALTRIIRIHGSEEDKRLDLEVQIETGVMHQIRCHLAYLGLPILGDRTYAPPPLREADRLYLHAWRLELPQFQKTGRIVAESPILFSNYK